MSRNQSSDDLPLRRVAAITRSDPHPPSGLMRDLNTKRSRTISASPAPTMSSPTPNREYRSQLDKLTTLNINDRQHAQATTPPNNRSKRQSQNLHDRNISNFSTSTLNSAVVGGGPESPVFSDRPGSGGGVMANFRFPGSPGPNESNTISLITNGARQFRGKIEGVITNIQNSNGLPPNIQNMMLNEIYKIGQEFDDHHRTMRRETDQAINERDNLYTQINDIHRKFRTVVEERDRYRDDIDGVKRQMNDVQLKAKKSIERLNELAQQFQFKNEELQKKVVFQEDQLKGKRALWMESHPESSQRRTAMSARDPFTSPSLTYSATFGSPTYGGGVRLNTPPLKSPSVTGKGSFKTKSNSGDPPRGPKGRRGNQLPTGKASAAGQTGHGSSLLLTSFVAHAPQTEYGDSPPPSLNSSLIVRDVEQDIAEFHDSLSTIYTLIEGWSRGYAHIPNLANDQAIARSNNVVWSFVCNCTYPGQRQDSHSHAMALLNDKNSRFWFIMRVAVQYIIREIMVIDAFAGFDGFAQAKVADVKAKMNERGLAIDARQSLIDHQAEIVQTILDSPDYVTFRNNQVAHHSRRLRDVVGPLMNDDASRSTAGRDLGVIVVKAWECAIKMFTSRLTFQVYFPETAQKFSAATMIAKDQTKVDPMQLQIKQTCLKLVITPVVTLRDDRGTTIKAKNLHLATVLTMV